jgi:hypothetical protein
MRSAFAPLLFSVMILIAPPALLNAAASSRLEAGEKEAVSRVSAAANSGGTSTINGNSAIKGRFLNSDGFPVDFTAPWEVKLYISGDWKTSNGISRVFSPNSSKDEVLFKRAKDGYFIFENLPPGRYRISLKADEFKNTSQSVVVAEGRTRDLDIIVAEYTSFRYLQRVYLVVVTTLLFLAGFALVLGGLYSSARSYFVILLGLLVIFNNWYFLCFKLAPWPRYSMILLQVIIIIFSIFTMRGRVRFLRILSLPFRLLLPQAETSVSSSGEMIGLSGKVVSESVTREFGLIHVINERKELAKLYAVLAEGFEPVARGAQVVLISYDSAKRVYVVIAEEALKTS